VATAVLGAAVAASGPVLRVGHTAPTTRDAGVFRYPLGCLGAAVSAGHLAARSPPVPDPCFHYGVYVTAVLRRSGDIWRLGLEAVSPSCPTVALPREVRANLVRCERRAGFLGGF
jgi:hypothetical protein